MALQAFPSLQKSYDHVPPSSADVELGERLLQHTMGRPESNGNTPNSPEVLNSLSEVDGSNISPRHVEEDARSVADGSQHELGFSGEEGQDRDSDPRYAPIKHPPTHGQICRYKDSLILR